MQTRLLHKSSEDYSWGSEGQNGQQAGAESDEIRAIDVFNAQPRNDSSSVSVDLTYSQLEEPGFSKPYDVRQFVAGERYEHDDVTLEITSDGIYANGNKISTSTPVSGTEPQVWANHRQAFDQYHGVV